MDKLNVTNTQTNDHQPLDLPPAAKEKKNYLEKQDDKIEKAMKECKSKIDEIFNKEKRS